MTDFLIFQTEGEALSRSREAWESVLGRKKNLEDVTEFLWGIDMGNDGRTALIISERADLLTASENLNTTPTLDANWTSDEVA